ncbi:unnamed protein product [Paramecium octaurelia]|uniref:Uncharacterized protein n=1 Tax=Paramecium octaurelia TaxID=43137 RepID=A0A8S1YMA4_PAROT|nr:unnamed protein product [Paramecium octaurelia]
MRLEVGDIEEDDGKVEAIGIENLMNRKDEYIQCETPYLEIIQRIVTQLQFIRYRDLEKNDFCLVQRLIPINKIVPKMERVEDVRSIMSRDT